MAVKHENSESDIYKFVESENKEYEVCAYFGCGEMLTIEECLYGKYCQEHQGVKERPIDLIDKYISE